MKFYLKADLSFEAEDLYAACQRLRLHFADCAGVLARGGDIGAVPAFGSGQFEIQTEGPIKGFGSATDPGMKAGSKKK